MPVNHKDQPARTEYTLKADERIAICRCWQSEKFPFCDGAHRCFNTDNADNLGPMIVCGPEYQKPE